MEYIITECVTCKSQTLTTDYDTFVAMVQTATEHTVPGAPANNWQCCGTVQIDPFGILDH